MKLDLNVDLSGAFKSAEILREKLRGLQEQLAAAQLAGIKNRPLSWTLPRKTEAEMLQDLEYHRERLRQEERERWRKWFELSPLSPGHFSHTWDPCWRSLYGMGPRPVPNPKPWSPPVAKRRKR